MYWCFLFSHYFEDVGVFCFCLVEHLAFGTVRETISIRYTSLNINVLQLCSLVSMTVALALPPLYLSLFCHAHHLDLIPADNGTSLRPSLCSLSYGYTCPSYPRPAVNSSMLQFCRQLYRTAPRPELLAQAPCIPTNQAQRLAPQLLPSRVQTVLYSTCPLLTPAPSRPSDTGQLEQQDTMSLLPPPQQPFR